jgi:EAL domain-containing protein (putative c-di-GMP-specific phosphodiesterase class I)
MTSRHKWNVIDIDFAPSPALNADALALSHLIEEGALTTHFQPIFSGRDGGIYACEALARVNPKFAPDGPAPLFAAARQHGLVAPLDRLCRQKALECAARQGLAQSGQRFSSMCVLKR